MPSDPAPTTAGQGALCRLPRLVVRSPYALTIILMALFTVVYYWGFFDLSKDVARQPTQPGEYVNDIVPQFGVHARIWRRTVLQHHRLPHWNPTIMGGLPFLAEPATNLLSLQNLVLFPFRDQVMARLSIPLHLLLGWIGLLLFLRRLGFGTRHALLAGVLFLFNPLYMAFHTFSGHPSFIQGLAVVPWLFYVAVRPFAREWTRFVVLGALLALILHSGAATVFLYSSCFGFPAYFAWALLDGRNWRDVLLGELLTIAVVLGLGAVRILPAMSFISVSGRAHGMTAELAFPREYEAFLGSKGLYLLVRSTPLLVASYAALVPIFALAAFGTFDAMRRNKRAALLLLVLFLLPICLAGCFPLFSIFRKVVPFFGSQRHPQRGLFVSYLLFAVSAAAGMRALETLLQSRRRLAGALAAVFVIGAGSSAFFHRPPFPTMVDDLDEQRDSNPVLAFVRQDPEFSRLTSYQDVGRFWSWEHQTVPLELRVLVGYPRLWHADMLHSVFTDSVQQSQYPFIPALYENYAAMAGLLSVKYVSSLTPLREDGLELLREFPIPTPDSQPPRARGPYLYENLGYMPRAYTGPATLLLNGPDDWCRGIGLRLLTDKHVDPKRLGVIYRPPDATLSELEQLFANVERIATHNDFDVPAEFAAKQISDMQLLAWVADLPPAVEPLRVEEPRPERLELDLKTDGKGRWIILSEKCAMFAGWTAELENGSAPTRLPLFRCNHVNTAIWIPPDTAGELRLTYRTPHFALGVCLFVITLCGIGVYARMASR